MSFSPPGTITGAGTTNTICKFTAGTVIGDSLITDDATTVTVNTRSTFLNAVPSNGSSGFITVTGTLPSVPTSAVYGVLLNITGAGNQALNIAALEVALLAGYTGNQATIAIRGDNGSRSTGTDVTSTVPTCNIGTQGRATGTAVTNLGVHGRADSSTNAYGTVGAAAGSAISVGASGVGLTGTTRVGGYFSLSTAGTPTLSSAALIADNFTVAAPIAIFRDNGTAKVTINDGGSVTFASGTRYPIVTKTIDYTATTDDFTILVDASIANTTITLPVAATCPGQVLNVKKTDATAHTVILDGAAAETIDGALTQTISARWDSLMLQSDGVSAWFII